MNTQVDSSLIILDRFREPSDLNIFLDLFNGCIGKPFCNITHIDNGRYTYMIYNLQTISSFRTSCTYCDYGYYSPTGYVPCAACPSGMTTVLYDQTTCINQSLITLNPTFKPISFPTPGPSDPTIKPSLHPFRSRIPTFQPTLFPTYPSECLPGYYSNNGFALLSWFYYSSTRSNSLSMCRWIYW
jgi:hypothetical protein